MKKNHAFYAVGGCQLLNKSFKQKKVWRLCLIANPLKKIVRQHNFLGFTSLHS